MNNKYIYMIFDGEDECMGTFLNKRCAELHLAWLYDNNEGKYFEMKSFEVLDDIVEERLHNEGEIHKGITVFYCPYDERKYGTGNGWTIGSKFSSLNYIYNKAIIIESPDRNPMFIEYKISFEITGDESNEEILNKAFLVYTKIIGMHGEEYEI